jgi:hypothetical protein
MRFPHLAALSILVSCAPSSGELSASSPFGLNGRVAGPAQRCVLIDQNEPLRVSQSDPHTLLYGTGKTVWANHLGECSFHSGDALISHPIGSSYCRGDFVSSVDTIAHVRSSGCVLGEFIPYTR